MHRLTIWNTSKRKIQSESVISKMLINKLEETKIKLKSNTWQSNNKTNWLRNKVELLANKTQTWNKKY